MTIFIELKLRDKDKDGKWGGEILDEPPAYVVVSLQKDLNAVGIYTEKIDGDFGPKTEKAVKLFQWACANVNAYVKNFSRSTRLLKKSIAVTGVLNKASFDELTAWVKNNQITTGDLVRVDFSALTNLQAGSGFKKIASISVHKGELVVSKDALLLIKEMNKTAKQKEVIIKVNQALRVSGEKVTGAVVAPATKSQHLIGHALDCNIVDGNNWNNSATFKNGKESKKAKDFISVLKKAGYRWGGNFTLIDTPHFDKQVLTIDFAYDAKFFFNQRMISLAHPIPKEII